MVEGEQSLARGSHTSSSFELDPREGTVSGPGGTVRLEPKVMDVLLALAKSRGRVITRDELLASVWPGAVVTEHTLSRCVYQLRQALRTIAGAAGAAEFNPIETLPKRGYRLLAELGESPAEQSQAGVPSFAAVSAIPFVVGQWVRSDRFYGRSSQLAEILAGPRNCVWLLGTRRIGKTSLLKQVEYLEETSRNPRFFPVFWDFQGAGAPEELHRNFADALLDAEARLERLGIGLQDVEAADLLDSLGRLRRRLRARNLRPLLLCDEVEELIGLHRQDASLLRKLRHAMQSHGDVRTVLASTIRLWELAGQKQDTSPFLHGFEPPLYIERLSDDEATSLIRQTHLDPAERPLFTDDVVAAIRERCDNHPYLIQLVCKRCLETGSLEEAVEQVATDRMVSHFFSVDFDMLDEDEREIIGLIARRPVTPADLGREARSAGSVPPEGTLRRLENLGFIRRKADLGYELVNHFFRRWLLELRDPDDASEADRNPQAGPSVLEFVDGR